MQMQIQTSNLSVVTLMNRLAEQIKKEYCFNDVTYLSVTDTDCDGMLQVKYGQNDNDCAFIYFKGDTFYGAKVGDNIARTLEGALNNIQRLKEGL